ncbi:hypothetical protein ACFQL4_19455 [Halosimplex aquaticum]
MTDEADRPAADDDTDPDAGGPRSPSRSSTPRRRVTLAPSPGR